MLVTKCPYALESPYGETGRIAVSSFWGTCEGRPKISAEDAWQKRASGSQVADRLEQPDHAHAVDVGDELGLAPGLAHRGDAGEVVDLVGTRLVDDRADALGVGHVGLDGMNAPCQPSMRSTNAPGAGPSTPNTW